MTIKLLPLLSAALMILLLAALPVRAATFDCSASKGEKEMSACRQEHREQADQAVEDLQEKLLRAALEEPKKQTELGDAHAAWKTYREAQCRVDTFDSVLGNAYDIYWNDCLEGMARDRATRLQHQLDTP